MIIVVGIDALEYDLVNKWRLENLLLENNKKISTPEDIYLHTKILWPTIITGKHPRDHGIQEGDIGSWENTILEKSSNILDKILPESIKRFLSIFLRKIGFEHSSRDKDYYKEKNIETIFSGLRTKAIDVPQYNETGISDEIKNKMDRSFSDFNEAEKFINKCKEEFEIKSKELINSLNEPIDLVMCYFYSLDGLQHVFHSDEEFLKEWYKKFDELIGTIKEEASDEDEIIVVSDHGIKNGKHTDYAFFSSYKEELKVESILDVKKEIQEITKKNRKNHEEIKEELNNLGYI
ncbi:hypothetical protein C9439_03995 [archaeon SCG-AAA382B04]|nr:hypothetical protein C9439_03995 [archaeon SCG-AAA382B04]